MSEAERYARLHAIFEEVRRLPAPERAERLAARCGSDAALRREIDELLAQADDEDSDLFSESGIADLRGALEDAVLGEDTGPVLDADGDTTWLPERIGHYRVLRRLGQGGMGVVYEAEQEFPRRRVAIKLLHPELATPDRLRRFRHEAELLGRLQHPGIALIHEAGTYDLGRGEQPFFAMELVEGAPLGLYAEREGLDARAKLALLAQVADAVHHAHGRGVIHRDLKPDNVLVDGRGRPKVLDFGVARASEGSDLLSTRLTRDGVLVGTLAYMAPEQLSADSAAVTPRADVYALGVIAFELLSGRLPRDIGGLSLAAALAQLERGPSRSLGTLVPSLRGDVDTIVSKALSREPWRRYESAAALAADIRRHLDDLPIAARPPSRTYLVRKYVHRNRSLVASLVAVFLALAVGLVVSASQYLEARKAAALADARYEEILRLADLKRLADAREAADGLWPAHPGKRAAMRAWLATQATPLARNLPRHRATLSALDARAVLSEEQQWQRDAVAGLVADLETLVDPDPRRGLIADVEQRLAFADSIEERSIAGLEARARWREASADVATLDVYGGLELTPQLGLVPLGRDVRSGLWEFWHPQTGERPPAGFGSDPEPGADAATRGARSIDGATGLVFVLIPGGSFHMGAQATDPGGPNHDPLAEPDEGPVHEVTLAPFFLSKYEMTQAQWQRFTGLEPSNYGRDWAWSAEVPGSGSPHANEPTNPVEQVSWIECTEVLRRLGLTLPTEAQWEYAARAGTDTPWWTGRARESIGALRAGNVADARSRALGAPASWPFEPWEDPWIVHAPVGRFAPNAFGLHDTLGNLWEWCADPLAGYESPVAADTGLRGAPEAGERRIARGGSFGLSASVARSAVRYSYTPEYRNDLVGVRPARHLTD